MFRYLFLSLLVYANGSLAPRVPPPTIQEPVKPAIAGQIAGDFVRPGVLGLVPFFLPRQSSISDELPNPAAPAPEAVVYPDFAFSEIVVSTAEKYGVDWRLVAAVISAESNFNPRARSSRGARGLMQVVPATGRIFDVKAAELYDPAKNVEAGVQYLKLLHDRYNGNLEMVVAAYNTGEGAVDRHHGVPPYKVTRAFVKKVMGKYREHQDSAVQAKGTSRTRRTLLTENSGPGGR